MTHRRRRSSCCGARECALAKPMRGTHPAQFEGNYQAYIEDLKRRKGPDADQPHRIAYKKLVRA